MGRLPVTEGSRRWRAFVVVRDAVVGDRLPRRRVGDVLPVLRLQPGVLVERAQADAPDAAVRLLAEQLAAALGAEAFLPALVRRLPAFDELFALHEAQRLGRQSHLRRPRT